MNPQDFPPLPRRLTKKKPSDEDDKPPVLKLKTNSPTPSVLPPPLLTNIPMKQVHRPSPMKVAPLPPPQMWYTDPSGTVHIVPMGMMIPNVPVVNRGLVQGGKLIGFE